MKLIWQGLLAETSLEYRVLLDANPKSLGYVIETLHRDALGTPKWDLEPLDGIHYKRILARVLADLTAEPVGFKKCEFCNGTGYDDYQEKTQ